jgi:uncharacterized membrane protein YidH (DUF202 family)
MSNESKRIPESEKATEYLANERTFLAWIRTSIAIVSIGIILAKVSPFLRQQQAGRAVQALPSSIGTSLPMGLAMIVFGAVLPLPLSHSPTLPLSHPLRSPILSRSRVRQKCRSIGRW